MKRESENKLSVIVFYVFSGLGRGTLCCGSNMFRGVVVFIRVVGVSLVWGLFFVL